MKIPGLWFVFLLLGILIACKSNHDKEGSLTLHFKATFDGHPLPMLTTEAFTPPEQLQFTHLSFYISDLALLEGAGQLALRDIDLVDMSFDDIPGAVEGYTIRFDHLTARNYDGIRFGIGVPPDLNSKKPADFSSTHPLSNPTNYWPAWDSYIFMKTEGRLDTLGNSSFDTGFAYHTGTNELYRVVEWPVTVSIAEGENKDLDFNIDYRKILEGIDIKSQPQNHNPKDSVQIRKVVDNIAQALTLVQ